MVTIPNHECKAFSSQWTLSMSRYKHGGASSELEMRRYDGGGVRWTLQINEELRGSWKWMNCWEDRLKRWRSAGWQNLKWMFLSSEFLREYRAIRWVLSRLQSNLVSFFDNIFIRSRIVEESEIFKVELGTHMKNWNGKDGLDTCRK